MVTPELQAILTPIRCRKHNTRTPHDRTRSISIVFSLFVDIYSLFKCAICW